VAAQRYNGHPAQNVKGGAPAIGKTVFGAHCKDSRQGAIALKQAG
jgi:hypothetical protein